MERGKLDESSTKARRMLDRAKWAMASKEVGSLRGRIMKHNGSMSLLLMAAGK
jgi:hypothetical protein